MNRLLLTALMLAAASAAQAETIDADSSRYQAAIARVIQSCAIQPVQQRFLSERLDYTVTATITGWTGGCVDGKRDGHGTLSDRSDTVDNKPIPPGVDGFGGFNMSGTSITTSEGSFVRGERLGLWCTTLATQTSSRGTVEWPLDCQVFGKATKSDRYRKQADGRWRLLTEKGQETVPASYVAAGVLETQSARLIADARAGRDSGPVQIAATAQALDDLIGGGQLTMKIASAPLGLKSKRVALVLTGGTLKELERFKAMRQSLIDASARIRDPNSIRAQFMTDSDPAKLLAAIGSGVVPNVGLMFAADDLAVLAEGKADYALLIDWRFKGDFNLLKGKGDASPKCDIASDGSCLAFNELISAMIVDAHSNIVRQFSLREYPVTRDSPVVARNQEAEFLEWLDHALRVHWIEWPANPGLVRTELSWHLQQENAPAQGAAASAAP